jgi:UDP-N-acetylglucosamine acyltransferase
MSRPFPHVHPTAIISPNARLAEDVTVGPFAVIDGPVVLGPGCAVGPRVSLLGRVTAGQGNRFLASCTIGGEPQHRDYQGEPTGVRIGDFNTFHECATVHRAMPATGDTVVGSHNLFMEGSHVAHDCRVGDHCTFASGAVIGGHVEIADGVMLSENSAVHQLCRVGKLALLHGATLITQDMPPFWVANEMTNGVQGVNIDGMKGAGYLPADVSAILLAFRAIHLAGLTFSNAVAHICRELCHSAAVRELVEFVQSSKRGICSKRWPRQCSANARGRFQLR